jgi:hypothetical protein
MNVVKKLLPRTWRTEAMHERYTTEREPIVANGSCPLCEAPTLKSFNYWRIVKNIYPYDAVADVHDLLLPLRHTTNERTITEAERDELLTLKESWLNEHYALIFEALPKNKSIPGHHHLHLIVPKVVD